MGRGTVSCKALLSAYVVLLVVLLLSLFCFTIAIDQKTYLYNPIPFLFSSRHTTPEKFFIEACDEGADAVLAIDRVSNEMTLTGREKASCKPLKKVLAIAPANY